MKIKSKVTKITVGLVLACACILSLGACADGYSAKSSQTPRNLLDIDGDGITDKCSNSVTVSWVNPTKNTDGTPLTDLATIKLYFGTTSRNYSNEIALTDLSLNSLILTLPPDNIYYFSLKAIKSSGAESAFSSEKALHLVNCPGLSIQPPVELAL
jgi:hypothetical protein